MVKLSYANLSGGRKLVSVLVSVADPFAPRRLVHPHLRMEARVGIGRSLKLVIPLDNLSQLSPPEARSILDASCANRIRGFWVRVKHSVARAD